MSSDFPTSTGSSEVSQFLSLTQEEKNEQIREANPDKLLALFSGLLDTPEQPHINPLEAVILHRIGELKEQLTPDQIHTIHTLCLEKLSPHIENTDDSLKTEVDIFLSEITVDQNNLLSTLKYAHKNKSGDLLNKCFAFIQSQTNVELACQDFGPISINFGENNTDSDLASLEHHILGLIDAVDRKNIQINLIQGCDSNISLENLQSFVNTVPDCIHTLNIRKTDNCLLNNDGIKQLLLNCLNLHHLFIRSDIITEEGLRDLSLLTSLQTLNFSYCNALTALNLLDSLNSLQTLTFIYCNALAELNLPDTLTSLQTLAVRDCEAFKTLNLPVSLTSLQKIAVIGCAALTALNLPDTLTSLQMLTVNSCRTLTALNLPDNLTSLQTLAVSECRALATLNLPDSLTSLQTLDVTNCGALTELNLPDSFTSLQMLNVNNCRALATLNLPDTLTSLQTLVIRECTALTALNLPDSLTTLQTLTVNGCTALTTLNLPDSFTSLQKLNVNNCRALATLNLPDSLTSLQTIDVTNCGALKALNIPGTLTSLHTLKVSICRALTALNFLGNLTSLQTLNVSECDVLTALNLPDTLTTLQSLTVGKCLALTALKLPYSLTFLQTLTVSICHSLTTLNLPDSFTSLQTLEVSYCAALTALNLPDTLTSLRKLTVIVCADLTALNLPDTLTSLQKLTVRDCRALTALNLPDSLTSLRKLNVSGCPLSFTKDLIFLASSHPDAFRDIGIHPKLVPFSSILNILKMDENSEEPLTKKINELKSFVNAEKKLASLAFYMDDIESKHPAEQLPLLRFIAYTAGLMLTLPDEQTLQLFGTSMNNGGASSSNQVINGGDGTLLQSIYNHKFAPHRYIFIKQAVRLAETDPNYLSEKLPVWKNNWTKLAALTLGFTGEKGVEILDLIDNNKDFKDSIYFNTVVSFLSEVCRNRYSYREKLESVLQLTEETFKKKTALILQTVPAYENISKLFGVEAFLSCIESKEDPQTYFRSRFGAAFELSNIENLSEKYSNTFAKFRVPLALFVYLGRIKELQGDDGRVKDAFKEYITSVLEGNFRELRYSSEQSTHLQTIFEGAEGQAAKDIWQNNRPAESLIGGGERSAVDYREFFRQKILTDEHLKSINDLPRLKNYLENGVVPQKKKDTPEDLFQDLLIDLCAGKIKIEKFIGNLKGKKLKSIDLGELSNDIESLKPQDNMQSKFTIMETDDPCDLLMVGTEIRDSCQRVDGDPELNKCLVSYMLNGEIKAIAVKVGGKIVARSLIRVMWDPEAKRRVILQERIYNNMKGDIEIENRINEWAVDKAKQMNCPLVSVEVNKNDLPYKGEVTFLGGFAPFTYSDASQGVKLGPFNTVGCHILYEPPVPPVA